MRHYFMPQDYYMAAVFKNSLLHSFSPHSRQLLTQLATQPASGSFRADRQVPGSFRPASRSAAAAAHRGWVSCLHSQCNGPLTASAI
jgi:hypothetical protein